MDFSLKNEDKKMKYQENFSKKYVKLRSPSQIGIWE
jgi:hypothetical protein